MAVLSYYANPCITPDMSLMINPTIPTATIPSRQILTESQSSPQPGFLASFNSLAHDWRNDVSPKATRNLQTTSSPIKRYFCGNDGCKISDSLREGLREADMVLGWVDG